MSTEKLKLMKSTIDLLKKRTGSSIGKKIIIATCAVVFMVSSAFASGEETKEKALSNLKKEFNNAKNIEWKATPDYLKASFNWKGQHLEVYYNYNGETIAKSRSIGSESLPLTAQQIISQRYPDYSITEAVEYNSDEENCYYASVVKNNSKVILHISSQGDEVTIFQK